MDGDGPAPGLVVLDTPAAVIVWSRPLTDWDRPELTALLDPPTLARLHRLRREIDRARMVTARKLIADAGRAAAERDLLGTTGPVILHERADGRGGPTTGLAGWRASISHDNAVVAVLARAVVGVDTQGRDSAVDVRALTSVFTDAERDWWAARGTDADALRLWTAKEALLKARGTGFLSDPGLPVNDTLRRADVRLAHWRPFPDAVAALAVLGDGPVEWPAGFTPYGP